MTAAPIVLGVDYSPCSLAAARHAARAARVGSRPLHVVRVIDDLVVFDMAEIARADAESIRADIRAYEGQALANLTSSIGAPPDV
jgi:nucleotide-binding universal stress UspA family protein